MTKNVRNSDSPTRIWFGGEDWVPIAVRSSPSTIRMRVKLVMSSTAWFVGKRLRVIGTMLRTRSLGEKLALTDGVRREILPLFATGALRPVVDSVYPLTEAAQAHAKVAANENFGKVVLRVRP